MTSIRRQLLVSLFVAPTLAGISAAVGVYLPARREANVLFDYHLKQIVLALRDHAATAIAVASSDADDAEQDVVIQIWDDAGLHLYNSYPGHPPPPQTGPGWTTVTTRQDAWHVFSLSDDDRIIQVAQPLVVRSALATQMAARTLLPWLVVLGLAGVIWWVVGRGLQPLMAVAHAVTACTPEALESLPLLAAVIADHALLAAERGTDVGLVHADPGWIRGDADSLRLLFANLLDQALRYTPAGGTVDVASTTDPQAIRVEVSDTGPGILSADTARVFDRFYRGANTTVSGTGLGLAMVKTIAERHHATVTLHPRPDRPGLVVCVTFPRC